LSHELTRVERDELFAGLANGDEEARREAAQRLHLLPAPDAFAAWCECLGDASWRVRSVASRALAERCDDPEVPRALVRALADPDNAGRRNGAAEALIRAGRSSVSALSAALADPDADLRKLAIDALARIGDPRASAALEQRLSDADPNVRAAAAEALGSVGGRFALLALGETLARSDEDTSVRLAALVALEALGATPEVAELESALADPLLRASALRLLGRSDEPGAQKQLVAAVLDRSSSSRDAAMASLVAIAARAEADELAALRSELATALAGSNGIAAACARLATADLPTQLTLVQFLGLCGDPIALRALLGAARDEALLEPCVGALTALGPELPEALAQAWPVLGADARAVACRALARDASELGASLLLRALGDSAAPVALAGARGCGERRIDAALPGLVDALETAARAEAQDGADAVAVLETALRNWCGDSGAAARAARASERVRARFECAAESARAALARCWAALAGEADAAFAAQLLRSADPQLRAAAALATSRLAAAEAAELSRRAAADECASVRAAAARAWGLQPPDVSTQVGIALARDLDPIVRASALRSFAQRIARGAAAAPDRDLAHAVAVEALCAPVPVALAAAELLRALGGSALRDARALLASPELELVCEGIRCVADAAHPELLSDLQGLVAHPDWSVRGEALAQISRLRLTRALPALLGRLEHEQDSFVRGVLLAAIERLEAGA
jgi:HEAT repeat protein